MNLINLTVTNKRGDAPGNNPISNKKVMLGDCKYNPKTRIITRPDGTEKKLSHVPSDLLQLLYSNPEHYFSLDELQEKLWQNKTIESGSIARWISAIRKDLGETSDFTYIENRRNQGYRFAAEVKKIKLIELKYLKSSLTLIMFLSPLYIGYINYFAPAKTNIPETLTSLIGQELDGAYNQGLLVFSHKPEGDRQWSLYAKKETDQRSFALTHNKQNNRRATFSPDGNKIAFQRVDKETCQIIVADIDRTAMVLENETVVYDCIFGRMSVSITWKDLSTLYLSYRDSPYGIFGIHSLDLNTSEMTSLITPTTDGQGDYYISYSQTANKLVYFRNIGFSSTEIWTYEPEYSLSKFITRVPLALFTAAWVKDDKELVVRTEHGTLGVIDLISDKPMTTALAVNYPLRWLFSIDNNTVGYVHGHLRDKDILKVVVGGEVKRVASSSFHESLPVFSKQSGALAFVSDRTGHPQVWLLEESGDIKQLTDFKTSYRIAHLAISDSGKTIAYTTATQMHLVSNEGNAIFSSPGDVVYENPAFSKDGQILYYAISYEGVWRVESRRIDNIHVPINLAEGYIMKPCEGLNCLYIVRHNDTRLYKLEDGAISVTGIALGNILTSGQLDISEGIIHFVDKTKEGYTLKRYDIDNQTKRSITLLPSAHFSINPENNVIYTSKVRESETMLEKVHVATGQ